MPLLLLQRAEMTPAAHIPRRFPPDNIPAVTAIASSPSSSSLFALSRDRETVHLRSANRFVVTSEGG